MGYFNKILTLGIFVILLGSSGCLTWDAKIDDMRAVYSEPDNSGAPRIIITDLSDKRTDTQLVGRISALNLATETPVNVIITNRIASKLKYAGFNIQKVELTGSEAKSNLTATLKQNRGKMLFTGSLEDFFIESSDAILETAKGRVFFGVDIINESGESLFHKKYTAHTEKHIGLGGGPASEELIKTTIQATVDELFNDTEFQQFLSRAKNN
jgi:hypothetical protein